MLKINVPLKYHWLNVRHFSNSQSYFANFTFETNIDFPFRLYLHNNLDLKTENNVKQLQRPKASLKMNEKLPGSARESDYL